MSLDGFISENKVDWLSSGSVERFRETLHSSVVQVIKPAHIPDLRAKMVRDLSKCPESFEMSYPSKEDAVSANRWARAVAAKGPAIFVTSDMTELVDHAAREMPVHELTHEMPLNMTTGLVFLARPLTGIDCSDHSEMHVSAMYWYPGLSTDTDPPHPVIHIGSMTVYQMQSRIIWLWAGSTTWSLGAASDRSRPQNPSDARVESAKEDRHRISTIWSLAAEPRLVERSDMIPSRATARRAARRGIDSGVHVIDLRHSQSSSAGTGSGGRLTVRHVVRGHWRLQACGPKLAWRRPTWIAPHWRGPDDGPVDLRPKVWALRGTKDSVPAMSVKS